MITRTPLRERLNIIKKNQPVAYMLDGIEDRPLVKKVDDFERTLEQCETLDLLKSLGIVSGMSQDDISEKIDLRLDEICNKELAVDTGDKNE